MYMLTYVLYILTYITQSYILNTHVYHMFNIYDICLTEGKFGQNEQQHIKMMALESGILFQSIFFKDIFYNQHE